jgi:hypothetical protein
VPVITFSIPLVASDELDPDFCGMCGFATNLLVYVRIGPNLLGVCHDCITALEKGYARMLEERMKIDQRSK